MKKLIVLSVAAITLFAGEIQVGHGTFKLKGGFIGFSQEKSTDITTYSVVENHKNIFSSSWYYGYEFTWYDSDTLTNAQQTLVSVAPSGLIGMSAPTTIPAIDYKYRGLDANVILGRDLYSKNENQFFGLGVLLGVSLPYIDTGKSSSNNDSLSDSAMNAMEKSKTKISTFKIGPSFQSSFALGRYVSVYANGTYAYQTGRVKNDYVNVDTHVNGNFEEFDTGIKFQPFAHNYKFGFITLKPRLYFTLGYRYTYWKLKNVYVNVTGVEFNENGTDMNMKSSVIYAGAGYSF
jgi:hypothetical protein